MQKQRKLVIVGDSAFAEVAYECFTRDSNYTVEGFAVESKYRQRNELLGLPVVDFEEITSHYDPLSTDVFVAIVYSSLNRLRTRLLQASLNKGYRAASYISSRATVWDNVDVGAHCFIFEGNNLQPFSKVGSNVVLWSGNHLGHHSKIEDNCFISSHAVISGFCTIGAYSFLGVNCSVGNNVVIGRDNWIGPGVVITKDTSPNCLLHTSRPNLAKISATRFFQVPEDNE